MSQTNNLIRSVLDNDQVSQNEHEYSSENHILNSMSSIQSEFFTKPVIERIDWKQFAPKRCKSLADLLNRFKKVKIQYKKKKQIKKKEVSVHYRKMTTELKRAMFFLRFDSFNQVDRPVRRISQISRILRVPYSTVRRQINLQIDKL